MKKQTSIIPYLVLKTVYMFLNQFDVQTTTMIQYLEKQFHVKKTFTVWFQLSYSIVESLLYYPVIILFQNVNHSTIIRCCIPFLIISYVLLSFSAQLSLIMLFKYLSSLFYAIVSAAVSSYLQHNFLSHKRQLYLIITQQIVSFINILVPFVLSNIQIKTFTLMYLFSAVFAFFLFVSSFWLPKSVHNEREKFQVQQFVVSVVCVGVVLLFRFYQLQFLLITSSIVIFVLQIVLERSYVPLQFLQSLVHSVNQFQIVHYVQKKKLSVLNSARQILSFSASLLQFQIQKSEFKIVYSTLCVCTLIFQLGKYLVQDYEQYILMFYSFETLPNAIMNQYVQTEILKQKQLPNSHLGISVQMKQLGSLIGSCIGVEYWTSACAAAYVCELIVIFARK
ncbi:MFS_transporter superfamily [Hexamita inflata]|uniref:MFS transporter superfamily n=1 Tax=Hexamita inflata TaxID=28002 RepID=A0AA86UVF1_9EUKA|nr:MFS transporter superfamily [Hexamita inflata]